MTHKAELLSASPPNRVGGDTPSNQIPFETPVNMFWGWQNMHPLQQYSMNLKWNH